MQIDVDGYTGSQPRPQVLQSSPLYNFSNREIAPLGMLSMQQGRGNPNLVGNPDPSLHFPEPHS